jgi:hypothetical protein
MANFSFHAFTELSEINQPDSASFYIPTSRTGDNEKARKMLEKQIKSVGDQLIRLGHDESFVKGYRKPLEELLSNYVFWKHLSDGLAIFHNIELNQNYIVPIPFEPFHHVGKRFHLTQFIPYFNGSSSYFILALGKEDIKLFLCTIDSIGRIDLKKIIQNHDEQNNGSEKETVEKLKQNKGYGELEGEKIDEFLKEVDRAIDSVEGKKGKPLIVATEDEIFQRFKNICSYPHLHHGHISGNPDEMDSISMQEKAREILVENSKKIRNDAKKILTENKNSGLTVNDLEKALKKGHADEIETLFIQQGSHIWGQFDEENHKYTTGEKDQDYNECLIDRLVKRVFLNGGYVFIEEKDNWPDPNSPINAILRKK